MAAIDEVLKTVRAALPGAVDPVIKDALKRAIVDFCHRSRAWRETIQIKPVVRQLRYPVALTGAQIVEVLAIGHARLPMDCVLFDQDEILLAQAPVSEDTLTPIVLKVVLMPAVTNGDYVDWLPEELVLRFASALIDGTMAYMMMTPNKPYTNGVGASIHGQKFRAAMNQAGVDARKEYAAGPQRLEWRFPRFA